MAQRRKGAADERMSERLTAVELTCKHVTLQPLRRHHALVMAQVLAGESLYRFTGGRPPTEQELDERYRRLETETSPDGRDAWLNWVVVAPDGEVVGTVQATVAGDRSVGEVAWIVGEPHQGKGYASEAAEVLVRWLAGEPVCRVQAHILAGHAASEGVARRAGLHDTGTEANGENLWALDP